MEKAEKPKAEEDLEDKLIREEEEDNNYAVSIEWTAIEESIATPLLITGSAGNPSAFLKILFGDSGAEQIGTSKSKVFDRRKQEEKEEDVATIHRSKDGLIYVLPEGGCTSSITNEFVERLMQKIKPARVLLLDSVFKTKYRTIDYLSEANFLRSVVTSKEARKAMQAFAPAMDSHNFVRGLSASFLNYGEIN